MGKHSLISLLLSALRIDPDLAPHVRRRGDLYVGSKLHTKIDIAVTDVAVTNEKQTDRKILQLTQAWSFQTASYEEMTDSVKAWGFAMQRLRSADGAKLLVKDESIAVHDQVDLQVLFAHPVTAEQIDAFGEAQEVFRNVGAHVHESNDVPLVVERARELVGV